MRVGIIGLGRMGANIGRRLRKGGHEVVGFDRDPAGVEALVKDGGAGAASLEELAAKLDEPRIFWVMVPAGAPTESTVAELREIASPGDVIIDGGNSFFKDDVRRHRECAAKGRALCRCRDVGRRVGAGARLLPDDRRRRGGRRHARSYRGRTGS